MRGPFALLAILPTITLAAVLPRPLHRPEFSRDVAKRDSGTFWYETIDHSGAQSSYQDDDIKSNYKVFRNVVTDFDADNSGQKSAAVAIQNAIDTGATGYSNRSDYDTYGSTMRPAVVYLPGGTYLLGGPLQLYLGTVIIGDPSDPPVLQAAPTFSADHMIYGKDPHQVGTNNFFIAIKNVVLDSRNVDKNRSITLLDWGVSQATQLNNVVFEMPNFSKGHIGISMEYDYNSNLILSDLTFNGGLYGMNITGEQWAFKSMTFNRCTTGAKFVGGFDVVMIDSSFTDCTTGIDASGISGSIIVLDSSASNTGALLSSNNSDTGDNSIILENIASDGYPTVRLDGETIFSGSIDGTWVHGNMYNKGALHGAYASDTSLSTARTSALLSDTQYFVMDAPTYDSYSSDEVFNIKSSTQYKVLGDGKTDDAFSINALLEKNCGKVIYFPAGTYIVESTIFVPKDTRIVGDAYASYISAAGIKFMDRANPVAMVKVGNAGDSGVAQISDMMFTTSDILGGCKLVEVNMAGLNPGDVGFWNSHFVIGGAAGSKTRTGCGGSVDTCMAAWGLLHLTSTSSAYIENMWGWTADHDLDAPVNGTYDENISTGRGVLVEATKGTWLMGTAFEHHTLYQYNFNNAQNVFTALQQSETPYWQGYGETVSAPGPWADFLIDSDPTFNNCEADDVFCRCAWFELMSNSSDLFLYGGGVWKFGSTNSAGDGQQSAISIDEASTGVYLYGTNVHEIQAVIVQNLNQADTADTGSAQGKEISGSGGWGAVIAAYLYSS